MLLLEKSFVKMLCESLNLNNFNYIFCMCVLCRSIHVYLFFASNYYSYDNSVMTEVLDPIDNPLNYLFFHNYLTFSYLISYLI